ncbi:hypothetical protein ABZ631_25970 [Nocardiopsis alba]|uniref:hypothetical protein n=1 Tax=Nocardiopsis alba TaxID=53437 RepID=UPI0033C062BB
MKNSPRIHARRVLQGGAAFVAFGALGLASAMPAHADTYGWGYASALGGGDGTVAQTPITQGDSVSESFSTGIGDWLTVQGTTTAKVDAQGASATTVIDRADILITVENIEDILDPEDDEDDDDEDEPEDDTEDDDTDEDGDDESEDEDPDQGEDDGSQGGDEGGSEGENGSGGGEDGTGTVPGDGGENGSGGGEAPNENVEDDDEGLPGSGEESPGGDDEEKVTTDSADVIVLDEENSDLVDGSSTVIIECTITGISVTTTQSWDGEVTHNVDAGRFDTAPVLYSSEDGDEVELTLQPAVSEGVVTTEAGGFVWNDAYTLLYMNFLIDDEFINGYSIAESFAGITTGVIDDGQGGEGGEGGDTSKTPTGDRDPSTLPKTEARGSEPLAQTGTPLLGLIAAGAAITAGGGAAAFLARRKKNTEAVATDEG